MNLSLQDPFAVAKEYPESLANALQYGHCVTFQFSHKGDYLASGLSDGSVVIYDLASRGSVIAHLHKHAHIRPITSVSWSVCGRYLLTTAQDWHCKLWDLSLVNSPNHDSAVIRSIIVDGPIWSASINPSNEFQFTASLFEDQAIFVDWSDPLPQNYRISRLESKPLEEHADSDANSSTKSVTLVTAFTHNGRYVFSGTNKGWINVFDTQSLQMVHSMRLTTSNIKNLVMSPNGRKLAVNSSDRIIRQISLPDLVNQQNPDSWEFDVEHKYQDVVNRLQWNSVCFNHNGEFLVASTFGTQSSQDLYIWETSMGSLIKILEGSSEELLEVKWNYSRCMIGSNGLEYGTIYLWSVDFPQKWSALAPDFVEIDDNIEYEEKEDEFDIIDDDILNKRRLEEEDSYVDILTPENHDARGFDTSLRSFIIPINYERPIV
ncbi:chromatin binding protein [Yamadazyma tenuis]|uniref:WD40 repeat-like protein n=1 Tax=Candida tenuis (strain ATCC 10573 / BCRC 21748 / CBS 615 / JCM 9827 / NBRC 10315 / NRRL Y-1498 / VKM Y-70) TaxID=590646 RepID=G3B568_CANTC|nr:WD40 repeat-like protein [Yamadazyma tenuis ATCC 10573]XP_006687350.1 uncharacterized protein CANTEDRAFT_114472 [Yamadazyma tenuis ATCC 10573]EGV63556.1 WD40 repeat-like protein [Yamadazyma tenuis ATCC 10573]EGV63557.1 hypothetical protein CANTEDRAFT_114472 [Yamadazyma tenuis ATCC 10573]WEJ97030.1 chromatin binding protein [Yamadazyma tenuis]